MSTWYVYICHLLGLFGIYTIAALSLNLIVAGTGLLTLAHAGYFGLGAYCYAIATLHGVAPVMAVGYSIFVVVLASLALSLASWRLRGDSFVLVSLAIQFGLSSVIANWHTFGAPVGSWSNLTNGPFGISEVVSITDGWTDVQSPLVDAVLALFVAAVTVFLCHRLLDSPWWRALKAMRDDELATVSLGKNTRLLKVQVFAISSGLIALAGCLYASMLTRVQPETVDLQNSILYLSMVLIGGTGNVRGPIIGALVVLLLPEALRAMPIFADTADSLRLMAFGLLLIVIIHYRRRGLAGDYRLP